MKNPDLKQKELPQATLWDRLKICSFPPAAALGAFASFVASAFRPGSEVRAKTPQPAPLVQIGFSEAKRTDVPTRFEMEYSKTLVLGGDGSRFSFGNSLSGIAVDSSNRIYVLADEKVYIVAPGGELIRNWKAPEKASCIAVDSDGRIYLGRAGQVEIYSGNGVRIGGFAAGENGKPASITAIRIVDKEILVADAAARYIRRYTENGKQVGEIGTQNKTRGFMLPNKSLDMAVDSKGVIRATDSGRHRVTSWILDGKPAGQFGKFGLANPEDFVGCCNPVNIAAAPDGKIITAEKVATRVKVFDEGGKLLALIGPEHFDPLCTHLYLAVDSNGRILVGDPVRLQVKIFSAANKTGGNAQV